MEWSEREDPLSWKTRCFLPSKTEPTTHSTEEQNKALRLKRKKECFCHSNALLHGPRVPLSGLSLSRCSFPAEFFFSKEKVQFRESLGSTTSLGGQKKTAVLADHTLRLWTSLYAVKTAGRLGKITPAAGVTAGGGLLRVVRNPREVQTRHRNKEQRCSPNSWGKRTHVWLLFIARTLCTESRETAVPRFSSKTSAQPKAVGSSLVTPLKLRVFNGC